MYNDKYALMGMCGSAELDEERLTVSRKGVVNYFFPPYKPRENEFKIQYITEIPDYEGYKITQKRKSNLVISYVDLEFLELKGIKYQSIRTALNRYSGKITIQKISTIQSVLSFIDQWRDDYGKAKYGRQLHTGYDKAFFKRYFNQDDFYNLEFICENRVVGYAVISKKDNNGALNYIIRKSDHSLPRLSEYIDYKMFEYIFNLRNDVKICWGASAGGLFRYKMKFNAEKKACYFLTYKKMNESKTSQLKDLLGIIPVNVWNSTAGEWSMGKSKWNDLIDTAGMISGIENPRYATRENCLQGLGRFSQAVTGNVINGGASVLDPFACELILKLFMPKDGKLVYNPFGGGVQMGFVSGFFGYHYLATEIRQNQCNANNAICHAMQMDNVQWMCADSSTYPLYEAPDLVFSCPPYYKVEKYEDYGGVIPANELNSLSTYEEFRDMLFRGYKRAIDSLKENRFVVIMVGDSRDKNGAYYCTEAETELFLRDCGLHIYNRIVYLEHQITRSALSTISIQSRKLPKVEQKIIVAYKGNLNNIKNLFDSVDY